MQSTELDNIYVSYDQNTQEILLAVGPDETAKYNNFIRIKTSMFKSFLDIATHIGCKMQADGIADLGLQDTVQMNNYMAGFDVMDQITYDIACSDCMHSRPIDNGKMVCSLQSIFVEPTHHCSLGERETQFRI